MGHVFHFLNTKILFDLSKNKEEKIHMVNLNISQF
jgi:hypothetical protein